MSNEFESKRKHNDKMATENSLESVVLNQLHLPVEILTIFEELGWDLLHIIRISKDELANALFYKGTTWNIDEIFGRLVRWRQLNGYEIHNFAKIEIEEFWIEEEEQAFEDNDSLNPIAPPVAAAENLNPVVHESNKPGIDDNPESTDSANCIAARYDNLRIEPIACSSKQAAAASAVGIIRPSELCDSSSVTATADSQLNDLRTISPIAEKSNASTDCFSKQAADTSVVGKVRASKSVAAAEASYGKDLNPVVHESNKPGIDNQESTESANSVAAWYDSLRIEPIACSSKQAAAASAVGIVRPSELCDSSSATTTADFQSNDLQTTSPETGKPSFSTDCTFECSNHRFTPSFLSRLLQSTVVGKQILERGTVGPLTPESQRELVSIIADYHNQKGLQASESILNDYARAITALFRSESKDIYFIERGGVKKNPGGKIYNRIVNSKQKNAKRKHKEEQFLKAAKKAPESTRISDSATEPAAADAVVWLQRNTKPWGTTIEKWIASFPVRKPQLMRRELTDKLFKDFRQYEEECGYQLIDEDFRLLNVGDDQGLKKWEHALPKLIQYVDKPYKDELSKSVAEYIKSPHLSQCVQITAILLLLNNFLRPTKVTKTFKPSILSAQEDIILFAATDEQVSERLNEANSSYAQHGFPPVARLVFRGENIQSLTGVFEVHYRGITYKLETAARAIEVLVKLNTIFGLEFSRITRLVWNFVCSYLYEINVQEHYESINKLERFLATA